MNRNADVDAWFSKYDNPQRDLVMAVRLAMLEADGRLTETIKWQAPTFIYKGNLMSFFPKAKAHASLMFHTGASIPGTYPSFEGEGDVARSMKVFSMADLDAKNDELARIVRTWCDWKDGRLAS